MEDLETPNDDNQRSRDGEKDPNNDKESTDQEKMEGDSPEHENATGSKITEQNAGHALTRVSSELGNLQKDSPNSSDQSDRESTELSDPNEEFIQTYEASNKTPSDTSSKTANETVNSRNKQPTGPRASDDTSESPSQEVGYESSDGRVAEKWTHDPLDNVLLVKPSKKEYTEGFDALVAEAVDRLHESREGVFKIRLPLELLDPREYAQSTFPKEEKENTLDRKTYKPQKVAGFWVLNNWKDHGLLPKATPDEAIPEDPTKTLAEFVNVKL
jgi:hypothetical protein